MKRFFLPLFGLLALLALRSGAADEPKEFSFNYSYSFSKQTRVTSFELGYQRTLPGVKPVPFDGVMSGKAGILTKETVSFLNDQGEVVGTLESGFDATGRLQSQQLSESGKPARPLNWFQAQTQSPPLRVNGSSYEVRYSLLNGRLSERVLKMKLPLGAHEIRSRYDEQGRRQSDTISGRKTPMTFGFFYDKDGLSRIAFPAMDGGKAQELSVSRAPNGTLAQIALRQEGVLGMRMLPRLKDDGDLLSSRVEVYEEGLLSSVVVMDIELKTVQQEQYDEGVLQERKTLAFGEGGVQKLQTLEEFETGRLSKRTRYDDAGAIASITTFNTDGTEKSKQTFKDGVATGSAPMTGEMRGRP